MEKGYWEDSTILSFDGVVTTVMEVDEGLLIRLEKTYFYPESGGQLGDGGTVGTEPVIASKQDERGPYLVLRKDAHVGVGDIFSCSIDRERRLRHTQLHSAQHILSRLLEDRGIHTLSFHMTEDQASIEIGIPSLTQSQIADLEDAVERVIWSCLPVRTWLVGVDELLSYDVRRAPELTGGPIRLVQISGLDTNPCGGTHVVSTGGIGCFLITNTDKVRGNVRLYFTAGSAATRFIRSQRRALEDTGHLLTCGTADVVMAVTRLRQRDHDSAKQIKEMTNLAAAAIAQGIAARIADGGSAAVVLDWIPGQCAHAVANILQEPSGPFCVVIYPSGGDNGQFVCAVPEGQAGLLRSFVSLMETLYGAHSGGSDRLAQGKLSVRVTASQLEPLLAGKPCC